MNFYEYIKQELVANGLFDSMVEEVMPIIIDHKSFRGTMNNRWSDDVDYYPGMMKGITFALVKPVVLEWLEEKHPEAWFKPVFMTETDRNQLLGLG